MNDDKKCLLTSQDVELLKHAFADAIKEAAPAIAEATTEVIREQVERAVGRGVIGWIKRLALGVLVALIVWSFAHANDWPFGGGKA